MGGGDTCYQDIKKLYEYALEHYTQALSLYVNHLGTERERERERESERERERMCVC